AYVTAKSINNFQLALENYYDKNYKEYYCKIGNSKKALIEADFKKGIIEQYVKATEHNMELNSKKLNHLRNIGLTASISLISGFVIYIILILSNNI
ncbi:hypothetical protein C4D23_05470, partial [Clostridium perfringens]